MHARMQPDGRHDHTHGVMNGHDITHLQDHVVVDSKIFNARLHVLSCDVSGGADLVSQLLHSLFVRQPKNPTSPCRKAGQERQQRR